MIFIPEEEKKKIIESSIDDLKNTIKKQEDMMNKVRKERQEELNELSKKLRGPAGHYSFRDFTLLFDENVGLRYDGRKTELEEISDESWSYVKEEILKYVREIEFLEKYKEKIKLFKRIQELNETFKDREIPDGY